MQQNGCSEYRDVSRRSFLKASSAGLALAAMAPAWLPRAAFAQSAGARDVLMTVFLRGGADGMTMCAPYGDPNYAAIRPTIAIPVPQGANGVQNLDGFFCLPPAMTPLYEAYQNGHLAIVHAVGSPNWTRSHFDAMRWMETSSREAIAVTGWVGRHLSTTAPMVQGASLRGLSLGYGIARTLAGGDRALPIPDPSNFGYYEASPLHSQILSAIGTAYAGAPDPTRLTQRDTFQTIAALDAINFEGYSPLGGAVYPDTEFGRGMKASAALIKAQIGLESIHLDLGGWDTHQSQGPLNGDMAILMDDLARTVAAFYKDMNASNNLRFTLVVMSEFGRNAIENASQGTDHGTANAMWLLGGGVRGGRVVRNWPGLSQGQLFEEQDLQSTVDYRNVLAEVAVKRLRTANVANLFPGFNYQPLGLLNAA